MEMEAAMDLQVKRLAEKGKLMQAGMSSSLSPCSTRSTKRLRGGHELLFPCPFAPIKRMRGESAEGSSDSVGTPMPSSACNFFLLDLPDILLLEILLRLPIKSTFMCKSLCKRCCSLISGYYSSTLSMTLMFQHEKYVKVRSRGFQVISDHPSLCERYKQNDFDLSFLPFFPQRIDEENYEEVLHRTLSSTKLEATCNDLLLCSYSGNFKELSSSSVIHYYICNVVSRQFVELPPAPAPSRIYKRFDIVGLLCEEKGVGAPCSGGIYGSLTLSRYAVVRIESVGCRDIRSEFEVLIFCSETGSWSTFVISTLPHKLTQFLPGSRLLVYKDKLHLLTGKCLVVFDPFNDHKMVSRIIDLPRVDGWFEPHGLGVSGSRLRMAPTMFRDPTLSIWELEDYDKGIWCLAYKIPLADVIGEYTPQVLDKISGRILLDDIFMCVLAFHPDDTDIVYLRESRLVIRLNMRTKTEEAASWLQNLDRFYFQHQALLYPESALQLVHRWSHNPSGGLDLP